MVKFRTPSFLIATAILLISAFAEAGKSRRSPLRSFGDVMQIVNPVASSLLSSQEKGFGHHAFIYGQTWITMHAIKLVSDKSKWAPSKRPSITDKRDRYDGMPSGHTASAWVAAAYVRTFSEDYSYLSVPLYITAAITGYSRVYSKEHTWGQVISGAALAEGMTWMNSKLSWSENYQPVSLFMDKNGGLVRFEFKF
jgi:hypothetical protein